MSSFYLRDLESRSDIPGRHDQTRILIPSFAHVPYPFVGFGGYRHSPAFP